MEKETKQDKICKSHKAIGVTCEYCKEFKFKQELNKLYKKNKTKWRSFGEPYVSTLILFDEFIGLLKDGVENFEGQRHGDQYVICVGKMKKLIDKLTGFNEKEHIEDEEVWKPSMCPHCGLSLDEHDGSGFCPGGTEEFGGKR